MKKALKGLAASVAALALLLAVFVWRPEWFLTPSVLSKAARKLGAPYRPEWTAFEPRLLSESFLSKRLSLKADGFRFQDSSGTLKGVLERVDVDVTARLTVRGPVLTRVTRLTVHSPTLLIDASRPAAAQEQGRRRRGPADLLPDTIKRLRIENVDVRLDDFALKLASQSVEGSASVAYSSGLVLAAQLFRDTPEKTENLDVRMTLESDAFEKGALSYLRLHGRVDGDVEDSARIDARLSQEGAAKRLKGSADIRTAGKRLTARIDGSSADGRYSGRLSAALVDPASPLRSIAVESCDARAPYDGEGAIQTLALSCRAAIEPKPFGVKPGAQAKKIGLTLALDGRRTAAGPSRDGFEATVKAAVEPRKDWYEFRADLAVELAGKLGDLPRSLRTRHKLDARLKVPKFQDLVAYLDGTRFAVPAPLHVLQGPAEAKLASAGDSGKDVVLTYSLGTDLDSGRQKVAVAADGSLTAKNAFSTERRRLSTRTQVNLHDVRLELPWLRIGQVPAVSVDPRIKTGAEAPARPPAAPSSAPAAEPASPIDYVVRIKTARPVTLYTNINPAPVPITLDLTATPPGLQGRIQVEAFQAELFKKKGQVHHVALTPSPGSSAMNLDGLVRFKESDADIRVKLLGSTEKPRVVFESDPPMDQQAIVALLLFGKTPDDLDPDQSSTVSNSQSAMANGAFGLASLFLFASTPVQHVGYDPATQTYAVKFSLPGGASLEVGSGADRSRRLTLRKRLARRWVLETELERDPERERSGVTTFLQWFQRY